MSNIKEPIYLSITPNSINTTVECCDGAINIDLDADNNLTGIEIISLGRFKEELLKTVPVILDVEQSNNTLGVKGNYFFITYVTNEYGYDNTLICTNLTMPNIVSTQELIQNELNVEDCVLLSVLPLTKQQFLDMGGNENFSTPPPKAKPTV